MASLAEIVKQVISTYEAGGTNVEAYALSNDKSQVYAVNAVNTTYRRFPAGVVVMARVVGDMVIVDEDRTDRSLLDALMEQGIPREKIVLAYVGEAMPEGTS